MTIRSALVGSTGFVGGSLARQLPFDALLHRPNLDELRGASVELLALAAMRAEKWIVNAKPEEDRASLDRLIDVLATVKAERVLCVSTVDVYPSPSGVDETTPIDQSLQSAYGRHRFMLEEAVRRLFPRAVVVRLPGLYGPGLKKNALFDLLHGNELEKVNAAARFQFYDVRSLWGDFVDAEQRGIRLLNAATEPVSVRDVALRAYGIDFRNEPPGKPASYDMRTVHAEAMGGSGAYLRTAGEVLDGIARWVSEERARMRDAEGGA